MPFIYRHRALFELISRISGPLTIFLLAVFVFVSVCSSFSSRYFFSFLISGFYLFYNLFVFGFFYTVKHKFRFFYFSFVSNSFSSFRLCARLNRQLAGQFESANHSSSSIVVITSHSIIIIRRNRYCSASDSAYSYTFLRSVVSLSSVVCHTRAPCLNCSTDSNAIWQVCIR